MNKTIQDFWRYASTIKAPTDIRDAYIEWAGTNKLSLELANTIWRHVSSNVNNAFSKQKYADNVTVSGPAADVRELLQQGEGNSAGDDEGTDVVDKIKKDLAKKGPESSESAEPSEGEEGTAPSSIFDIEEANSSETPGVPPAGNIGGPPIPGTPPPGAPPV